VDRDVLLRLLLEQGEEHALILLDERGVVIDWLMGATRLFGRHREDMLGRSLDVLFTPEDRERQVPESELADARRAKMSYDDRWMLRSDDVRFWANGVLHSVRDDKGRVVGFAKILRDRTDQRGQMEALRNRAEAVSAQERRDALTLGTLAHEIRSPLAALANAAAIMSMASRNDEGISRALQVIERQTAYATALVDDWLEYARLRTGKARLNAERLDLGAVISAAVESVGADTAARSQRIEILLPPTPIQLEADRLRLQQVVVNLLRNASKFSRAGDPIWIRATIEGDEAVIRVEDRGSGIPKRSLPHVFEWLSQAGPPESAATTGLGVGLSLVKEYVELHAGSVQVRSDGIDRGSEFTVRLPLYPRGGASASPPPKPGAGSSGRTD
jgi:PAS domain S-box-containing protein